MADANNFEKWKKCLAIEDMFSRVDTLTTEGCISCFALGCDKCPAKGVTCIKADGFVNYDKTNCYENFLKWGKSNEDI